MSFAGSDAGMTAYDAIGDLCCVIKLHSFLKKLQSTQGNPTSGQVSQLLTAGMLLLICALTSLVFPEEIIIAAAWLVSVYYLMHSKRIAGQLSYFVAG